MIDFYPKKDKNYRFKKIKKQDPIELICIEK